MAYDLSKYRECKINYVGQITQISEVCSTIMKIPTSFVSLSEVLVYLRNSPELMCQTYKNQKISEMKSINEKIAACAAINSPTKEEVTPELKSQLRTIDFAAQLDIFNGCGHNLKEFGDLSNIPDRPSEEQSCTEAGRNINKPSSIITCSNDQSCSGSLDYKEGDL